jgi:monothiol glutaredoxin
VGFQREAFTAAMASLSLVTYGLHLQPTTMVTPYVGKAPPPPCADLVSSKAAVWRGRCDVLRAANGEWGRHNRRRDVSIRAAFGASVGNGGMTPELKEAIDKYLSANKVVLFMKGTKMFPQCGFSNTCVQVLNTLSVPYETVNILEDESLRQGMKVYSQWPTFPQLYIDGEFFGGCDITLGEHFQAL